MITADQILLHLFGDYLFQSDWMATKKQKNPFVASCHALAYSTSFLLLRPSPIAILFIFLTHFLIDHFELARYVVWAKNFLAPWPKTFTTPYGGLPEYKIGERIQGAMVIGLDDEAWPGCTKPMPDPGRTLHWYVLRTGNPPWAMCKDSFGYPPNRPAWLACWLLIVGDNCLHLLCNGVALKWL